MKLRNIIASIALALPLGAMAQSASVTIDAEHPGSVINKNVYGQFAEHLGSCIYGGLWVGPDSKIDNINGYRRDVFEALKRLQVPVLRWPGGCFADDYHWMDGIGPRSERPSLRNNNWGGTIEDNSFGTHEFLNLCEMLGCEPYISVNIGSGTVEEVVKWIEYMNCEEGTPMADLRKKNGREHAWNVKYIGVGNESWGCGGNMRPEYYSDLYKRYTTYIRNYGQPIYRIASGANGGDTNWTTVLMDNIRGHVDAISLHYYSVGEWNNKGKSTVFSKDDYYDSMAQCLKMDELIRNHTAIMDRKDPKKRIGLMVDEWGTWYDVEDGTNPGHLFQQNTLRDAFVAALTLNIFHNYADRVKMANIAQIVNVLQSMILTNMDGQMVLTPTYHVFEMYKDFQEAKNLPLQLTCPKHIDTKDRIVPDVSASAAQKADGTIVLSLANVDLDKAQDVSVDLKGVRAASVTGRMLTSKNIADHNDFSNPNVVAPTDFKGAKLSKDGKLNVHIPAHSIVVLKIGKK